jgi:endonuclease V-like protein UPF0215 family
MERRKRCSGISSSKRRREHREFIAVGVARTRSRAAAPTLTAHQPVRFDGCDGNVRFTAHQPYVSTAAMRKRPQIGSLRSL